MLVLHPFLAWRLQPGLAALLGSQQFLLQFKMIWRSKEITWTVERLRDIDAMRGYKPMAVVGYALLRSLSLSLLAI